MFSLLYQRFLGSKRIVCGLIALYTAIMLGTGFVLQYAVGLVPCPLCIIQRFFFGLVGVVGLVAAIHGRWLRLYAGVMFGFSTLGWLVAARNVYIEWAPKPELGSPCSPWFHSVIDWVRVVFEATGDCAARAWTLLGLSIPEWSLFAFSFLVLVSMLMVWGEAHSSESQPPVASK